MSDKMLLLIFWMATMCSGGVLGLSAAEIDEIEREHNRVRKEVYPPASNMQKMYWNKVLAAGAQAHADACNWGHNSYEDRDKGWGVYIGQNLAGRWSSDAPSWTWAIQYWESEKNNWNYGTGAKNTSEDIGHYTQEITHDAVLIGCGYAACPNNFHHFVCDYAASQISMNTPYSQGTACGACPQGTCVDNMCDCNGLFCQNSGSIDLNTCSCNCAAGFAGTECETRSINCNGAKEWPGSWCGQVTASVPALCDNTAWALQWCAKTCGLCPDL